MSRRRSGCFSRLTKASRSYRLLPRFWHLGYASEVARAVLKVLFTNLGLARVRAEAMATQAGTRTTVERLALTLIGDLDSEISQTSNDPEEKNAEYAITHASWENN